TFGLAMHPVEAAAAAGAPGPTLFWQGPSFLLILAVLTAVVTLAGGAGTGLWFHRRAGSAVEEAPPVTSPFHRIAEGVLVFSVIAEGVLVCSGLQVIAANTSICRQVAVGADEVGDLMLSSFIRDADAIERLLSDRSVELETQIHARDGRTVEVEIAARTIDY